MTACYLNVGAIVSVIGLSIPQNSSKTGLTEKTILMWTLNFGNLNSELKSESENGDVCWNNVTNISSEMFERLKVLREC